MLRVVGGEPVTLTDGPFAEATEGIGGFYVLEAPDLDVAVELFADHVRLRDRDPTRGHLGRVTPAGERTAAASAAVEQAWRQEWGRLLGLLVGRFRDVDLAEDALADAFEAAARTWPDDGVPTNPAAWLLTAARRRALDRLRGADTARRKLPLLVVDHLRRRPSGREAEEMAEDGARGRSATTSSSCCSSPATPRSPRSRRPRSRCGSCSACRRRRSRGCSCVPEPTMAARLTRAKKKIATAGLPFAMPDDEALPGRVAVVEQAIYLCFTAGIRARRRATPCVRTDLAGEAIRLARLLAPALAPGRGAAVGRRAARADGAAALATGRARGPGGELVLLADQDRLPDGTTTRSRTGWRCCARAGAHAGRAEELRLQAVIASRHATAVHADDTDWPAIASDYAVLERLTGSPVVRLNRVGRRRRGGRPRAGLALLEGLDDRAAALHRATGGARRAAGACGRRRWRAWPASSSRSPGAATRPRSPTCAPGSRASSPPGSLGDELVAQVRHPVDACARSRSRSRV